MTNEERTVRATLTEAQETLAHTLHRLGHDLDQLCGLADEGDYDEMAVQYAAMSTRVRQLSEQVATCRQAAHGLRRLETAAAQAAEAQAAAEAEAAGAPEGDTRGLPTHLRAQPVAAVMHRIAESAEATPPVVAAPGQPPAGN